MARRALLARAGAGLALLAGCAQVPQPPSPQDSLPPNKLAGMHRVWEPTINAVSGNCLQCHAVAMVQDRGGLSRNTAWFAVLKARGQDKPPLPRNVSYEDMLDLVRFVSEHYGVYHLGRPEDIERYNAMLKDGQITADPADGTPGHTAIPARPAPAQAPPPRQ